MAISIEWATRIISVPKADTVLIQSNPTEVRELNLNTFRLALKALEDDPEGMAFLSTHRHTPPVSVGGVTLARVVELINSYTVTFEDGQYAVNLIGSNSNIGDNVNVNQVSVRSANSAGLVQSAEIEFASFAGGVHVDQTNGDAGQAFPLGTELAPVDNMIDAVFIANLRGFKKLFIRGDYIFDPGETVDGLTLVGENSDQTLITLTAAASITNCLIRNASVGGAFDGNDNTLIECHIKNLIMGDTSIHDCRLDGVITILPGTTLLTMSNCISGIPGGDFRPRIDFDGNNPDWLLRNYSGGIELFNKTGASDVSLDMISGHVLIDSSVTAGTVTVRGITKITDNSTGTFVLIDETVGTGAVTAGDITAITSAVWAFIINIGKGTSAGTKLDKIATKGQDIALR